MHVLDDDPSAQEIEQWHSVALVPIARAQLDQIGPYAFVGNDGGKQAFIVGFSKRDQMAQLLGKGRAGLAPYANGIASQMKCPSGVLWETGKTVYEAKKRSIVGFDLWVE